MTAAQSIALENPSSTGTLEVGTGAVVTRAAAAVRVGDPVGRHEPSELLEELPPDADRSKWGPDLAPGAYSSITADIIREPSILVPPSGGLVAFGADRWVIHLSGRR